MYFFAQIKQYCTFWAAFINGYLWPCEMHTNKLVQGLGSCLGAVIEILHCDLDHFSKIQSHLILRKILLVTCYLVLNQLQLCILHSRKFSMQVANFETWKSHNLSKIKVLKSSFHYKISSSACIHFWKCNLQNVSRRKILIFLHSKISSSTISLQGW